MHWTYTELELQPAQRVEEALTFLALEGEALAGGGGEDGELQGLRRRRRYQ